VQGLLDKFFVIAVAQTKEEGECPLVGKVNFYSRMLDSMMVIIFIQHFFFLSEVTRFHSYM
jgi:hypothetical protein